MCPLIPNDSLTRRSIVGWKFVCFWHFEYIMPLFSGLQSFCWKKSVDSLIGDTLYVTSWFSLDAFRILSCSLTLATLIIMYFGVKLFQHSSVTQSHPIETLWTAAALLLLQPSIFPSIRVFSKQSVFRIRQPKYWSFSFSISPSNEYSRLISFKMDWFYLLAVQGTLKSLLQHRSWKASILWCSAFFMVQLSPPHITTGKIIVLTIWTFVGKVMSLCFNRLSRLVVTCPPRSMRLLIS